MQAGPRLSSGWLGVRDVMDPEADALGMGGAGGGPPGVRYFDGVNDELRFDCNYADLMDNTAGGGTGFSTLLLWQPISHSGDECPFSIGNATTALACGHVDSGGTMYLKADSPVIDYWTSPTKSLSLGSWQLWGFSRGSVNSIPRMHVQTLGGAWFHNDMVDVMNTTPTAMNRIVLGRFQGASGWFECRIAIAAVFNRVLSDAEFATVVNHSSQVKALNPLSLIQLNDLVANLAVDKGSSPAVQSGRTDTTYEVVGDLVWGYL